MDRVREDLYVGDSADYRDPDLDEVDVVVNLSTVELEVREKLERPVIDIPLEDGRNELLNFFVAVDTVKSEIQREGTTLLVTCREGVSRSPAVTATALASLNGSCFSDELEKVEEARPGVNPLPPLVRQCRYYLGEDTD
ncbi:MAG: dual specificity protein phosphatase family protein [Candidatus Nanohaloarchaea archaeon]